MKLVTSAEMRQAEERAFRSGVSQADMIQAAGRALVGAVRDASSRGTVVVLVGPGNNGSDGLACAADLAGSGHDVRVLLLSDRDKTPYGGATRVISDLSERDLADEFDHAWCVVDALLGTGQDRKPEGELARCIDAVNARSGGSRMVIAADVPTGVDADTGTVPGHAIRATSTVCMGAAKIGVFQYPGAEYAGDVQVADIGIPQGTFEDVRVEALTAESATSLVPARNANGSKGSSGSVLFVGGSRDFCGAPVMASMGAYRSGAGLVQIAVPESIKDVVAAHVVEPVYLPLPEIKGAISPDATLPLAHALSKVRSCVVGCGMSQTPDTFTFVERFLGVLRESRVHAVLDADCLNNMARIPRWWTRAPRAIITPHPGEMSRLTGLEIPAIQANRVEIARRHARQWEVVVVLKGAGTVVAHPDGRVSINTTGGPNLATAGTGDVLAGVIGGLLAQGCDRFDAARLGVFLHGLAGDLVREHLGNAGTIASDLLPRIPEARVRITSQAKEHP